jgi:molybdenum cofactor guanylyltransferase
MGTSKAALEWHGSTLLRRACSLVGRAVDGPVVVVRAPGQELPELPPAVELVDDPREGLGPLQGLAAGLAAVAGRAEAAYLSATDMPFLHPAFVRRVLAGLGADVDVALPFVAGHRQPLAAAYRTALAPLVAELVAAEQLNPGVLYERVRVRRLGEEELPELDSLISLDSPDDYAQARARPAPEVTVRGALVRAATLAAAATAAGLELDELVTLNGEPIGRDGELPLVAGDTIA